MTRLQYNQRIGRYTGQQSDGTYIEIDEDAVAEAIQDRVAHGEQSERTAREETLDPDGWSEEMAGWIAADAHLGAETAQ